MDYGHPLQFGTFITPTNAAPDVPVGLARLSEELGYDLVTFQDHPYQPRFLDTWTLMTWVAAQTERIHISANVLNVPMRPPAVTARAAASLDLLSGGRFDLALGAGGFWDAMEAMGARRLTPGQSVDALSEAIDVIRGIWAAEERTPLRVDGEHYRLSGAKRGPAPGARHPDLARRLQAADAPADRRRRRTAGCRRWLPEAGATRGRDGDHRRGGCRRPGATRGRSAGC